MIYLAIVVVGAFAGILMLWRQQRRQRAATARIDGLMTSLERLSAHPPEARPVLTSPASGRSSATRPRRGPAPLDPRRREAAKRRIEARRRSTRPVG